MSVNLIAPSKVQGCVLTHYIYIILLAALSLSISKPIFSFFCFWKMRRIHVFFPRTFHHIPAMIVVLKLQFVMSEMLEDVTQERRGRGNQIFEPSTFYLVGCAQTRAMISAQVWSWFDASFTIIWVIQLVHGVPKNFQQLQICQNKARIWTPLCARYPTHWELGCGACIEMRYFSCFRLITHYATVGLSLHDGECCENTSVFLWLRPCMCRNLYVKGTHLEREQSW